MLWYPNLSERVLLREGLVLRAHATAAQAELVATPQQSDDEGQRVASGAACACVGGSLCDDIRD